MEKNITDFIDKVAKQYGNNDAVHYTNFSSFSVKVNDNVKMIYNIELDNYDGFVRVYQSYMYKNNGRKIVPFGTYSLVKVNHMSDIQKIISSNSKHIANQFEIANEALKNIRKMSPITQDFIKIMI